MNLIKSDLNAPDHHTLRIDVTGFQNEDVCVTRLFIEMTCLDAAGSPVHTLIRTSIAYANRRLPDAICKDLKAVLKIGLSDKFVNRPSAGYEIVIHDWLSFAYATRQIETHHSSQRAWVASALCQARKLNGKVEFKLGSYALKERFRKWMLETYASNDKLTPTLEMTGDAHRAFIKSQKRRYASS